MYSVLDWRIEVPDVHVVLASGGDCAWEPGAPGSGHHHLGQCFCRVGQETLPCP